MCPWCLTSTCEDEGGERSREVDISKKGEPCDAEIMSVI